MKHSRLLGCISKYTRESWYKPLEDIPNIGVIKMWVSVDSGNIHGACWQQEGKTSVVHRCFQWDYHEFLNQQFTNNSPTVKNHSLVSIFSQYHKSDCQLESSTIGLSDNVGYAWVCHLIWLVVCHLIWMMKFPIYGKIIQMFETTNHPFIFHYQMVTHHEISIKTPFISLLNHHNPNVPNHHPVDNHY